MKRFHAHVSVADLGDSIRFYSQMFGAEPSVLKDDYAKWMLDDPRINFAISSHRQPVGVNHLGFQVDTDEELCGMRAQLEAADSQMIQEDEQPCCSARSDQDARQAPFFRASIPLGKDSADSEAVVSVNSASSAALCIGARC